MLQFIRKYHFNFDIYQNNLSFYNQYCFSLQIINEAQQQLQIEEEKVLLQALRENNLSKLYINDLPIFNSLINDLFPNITVPRQLDQQLQQKIIDQCHKSHLQPIDSFTIKIHQLYNLLNVRHSVFILGEASTGKTAIWKTLADAENIEYTVIDPKAIPRKNLYGYVNPINKEWQDGIFSKVLRDYVESGPPENGKQKWIVLSGDVDTLWIESINSLMDDSKVLTLPSNERISFKPWMRLIIEVKSLEHASPATVSRAGIIFVNQDDITPQMLLQKWLQDIQQDNLYQTEIKLQLNNKIKIYKPINEIIQILQYKCLKYIKIIQQQISFYQFSVFQTNITITQNMLKLLQSLLQELWQNQYFQKIYQLGIQEEKQTYKNENLENILEDYIAFSTIHAFGDSIINNQISDNLQYTKQDFDKQWNTFAQDIHSPQITENNTIFDYFITINQEQLNSQWIPFSTLIQPFIYNPDSTIDDIFIETSETVKIDYLVEHIQSVQGQIMLCGNSGLGKTTILKRALQKINQKYGYDLKQFQFNYYTNSEQIQQNIEQLLIKSGKIWIPKTNKNTNIIIDDINMPMIDEFGTQQATTFLRQLYDWNMWYDKEKIQQKQVQQLQIHATMNPTVGSFSITNQYQNKFFTIQLEQQNPKILQEIYEKILNGYFQNRQLFMDIQDLSQQLTKFIVDFHCFACQTFQYTVQKYLYNFNLRNINQVVGQILQIQNFTNLSELFMLVIHELRRSYGDKINDDSDKEKFEKLIETTYSNDLIQYNIEYQEVNNKIYSYLIDYSYQLVKDQNQLTQKIIQNLQDYNQCNTNMNLFLFDEAIQHINKISRALQFNNILLLGYGGSGKQSLAKLSSFSMNYNIKQLDINSQYNIQTFKDDLQKLLIKTGVRQENEVLLINEEQIFDEEVLVLLTELLTNYEIQNLYSGQQKQEIIEQCRSRTKALGLIDDENNCWQQFVNSVRAHLRIILCMSPSEKFKQRIIRFPSLINCTQIDQFNFWSKQALAGICQKIINGQNYIQDQQQVQEQIFNFLANIHYNISTQLTEQYYQATHKQIICTPKTYLELINTFQLLLKQRENNLQKRINILQTGIEKLDQAQQEANILKDKLEIQKQETQKKKQEVQQALDIVKKQRQITNNEQQIATAKNDEANKIREQVQIASDAANKEYQTAVPILQLAKDALNTLNKIDLEELAHYEKPPIQIQQLMSAVIYLTYRPGKLAQNVDWKAAKLLMKNSLRFIDQLKNFNGENINSVNKNKVKELMKKLPDTFVPEQMMKKSKAAGGLCSWIINIIKFNEVYLNIEPIKKNKEKLEQQLNKAVQISISAQNKVDKLENTLKQLTEKYNKVNNELTILVQQETQTKNQLDSAERLINGLQSEKQRWTQNSIKLNEQYQARIGDTLILASYITYAGGFNKDFRSKLQTLIQEKIKEFEINISQIQLLNLLATQNEIAQWKQQQLPNDQVSIENAAIFKNCNRWPYIIDPQLQGEQWIKQHYSNLIILQQNDPNFIQVIKQSIQNGQPVLIENIQKEIPHSIKNLINKQLITTKEGIYIQINQEEILWNNEFKLILQSQNSQPNISAELQSQVTLIDFSVTHQGLEEQLLADVISLQKPQLEQSKKELIQQQNLQQEQLQQLENQLLEKLSNVKSNIIQDQDLINQLEDMKQKSQQIEQQTKQTQQTEIQINKSRDIYRIISKRGTNMYFIIDQLKFINNLYIFNLNEIKRIFLKKFEVTNQTSLKDKLNITQQSSMSTQIQLEQSQIENKEKKQLNTLLLEATNMLRNYIKISLFTKEQILFDAQLTFSILEEQGILQKEEQEFIINDYTQQSTLQNPLPQIITQQQWDSLAFLSNMQIFTNVQQNIIQQQSRWQQWLQSEQPELGQLPGNFKSCAYIQQLCIIKALRPDRLTQGLQILTNQILQYENNQFDITFQDFVDKNSQYYSNQPIFFTLTPSINPLFQIEQLATKCNYTVENNKFIAISLGQGQEQFTEQMLMQFINNEGWIFLQNIHLMKKWQSKLLSILQRKSKSQNFRIFLSGELNPDPNVQNILPQILQQCIKITQEPKQEFKNILINTLSLLKQDDWDQCNSKPQMYKQLLFNLCFFHSTLIQRQKYTNIGCNVNFNISNSDLLISKDIIYNYLENYQKVPWTDLTYMISQIIYGGNVTDEYDQRYLSTFCNKLFCEKATTEDYELSPNVFVKYIANQQQAYEFIQQNQYIQSGSSTLVGLHPNSEINTLLSQGKNLCNQLIYLSNNLLYNNSFSDKFIEVVTQTSEKLLQILPQEFNTDIIRQSSQDPFTLVLAQECDKMNELVAIINQSIKTIQSGINGEVSINDQLQTLMVSIYNDQIPQLWKQKCFLTMKSLSKFILDLEKRVQQLQEWQSDGLKIVWLGGLFNPQSLLRSVIQKYAREENISLDQLDLQVEILKQQDIYQLSSQPCTSQASNYLIISGIHLFNAKWDQKQRVLKDAILKDLYPELPLIKVSAYNIQQNQQKTKDLYYECPIYKIIQRNKESFVWEFKLKTFDMPEKWIFNSVAGIMEVN